MRKEFVPLSIRFEPEMYEWMRKQAYETRSTINAIVRGAVEKIKVAQLKKESK